MPTDFVKLSFHFSSSYLKICGIKMFLIRGNINHRHGNIGSLAQRISRYIFYSSLFEG
ncbi:hypothetical protein TCARB_1707 [Thermofilum adornatum 1505]|uniref:Uncharacterized protein n=1 Tax=Thermofilum adornatum 1505 TaxID=697581 RepID=A0A3G1A9Z9_9CREN|nr:hypothetical protein TCARB_1707 [Thermofilum adornatum 1505]